MCNGATIYTVATRRLPVHLVEGIMLTGSVAVVCVDWGSRAVNSIRLWVLVVLLMDVMLAVGIRSSVQFTVLGITISWLVCAAVEDAFRLGLYDIPVWTESDLQHDDCSNPPCAKGIAPTLVDCGLALLILLVDYNATRGFADGLRQQTERLAASVRIAEQIAASLAHFDLDSAGSSLATHREELPGALSDSLSSLLANLASYRPYLPQSCFAGSDHFGKLESSSGGSSEDRRGSTSPRATMGSIASQSSGIDNPAPRVVARQSSQTRRNSAATGSTSSPPPSVAATESSDGRHHESKNAGPMNAPQQRRISALVCNRIGFLPAAAECERCDLAAWLAAEVEHFYAAVAQQKGVVDLISGDHLFAAFGAVRVLASHRCAAVQCAAAFAERGEATKNEAGPLSQLRGSAAVCTGRGLCGDFGSATAQRFMAISPVPAALHLTERAAAAWRAGLVADDLVREDNESAWDWRVCAQVTFAKRGSGQPYFLWQLVRQKPARPGGPDEWMYELEAAEPNCWTPFNKAVSHWCRSQWDDALGSLNITPAAENPAFEEAVAALRRRLALREPPPACELAAAAGVSPA